MNSLQLIVHYLLWASNRVSTLFLLNQNNLSSHFIFILQILKYMIFNLLILDFSKILTLEGKTEGNRINFDKSNMGI